MAETHPALTLALSSSGRIELPKITHKRNVDATERSYVSSSGQLLRTITSVNVTKTHIDLCIQLRTEHTDFINDEPSSRNHCFGFLRLMFSALRKCFIRFENSRALTFVSRLRKSCVITLAADESILPVKLLRPDRHFDRRHDARRVGKLIDEDRT